MKRYLSILTIMAAAVLAVSCDDDTDYRPDATGAPYEVLLVISDTEWNSPLGDTIMAALTAPVPMLNQREPLTDVYRILPSAFDGLLLKYGNIINVEVGPSWSEPGITVAYDVSARGQEIINITGPDAASVAEYVSGNRESLVQVIYMAERERYIKKMNISPAKDVMQAVREDFGFDMTIPSSYTIRSRQADFMWISFELRLASLGMAIYKYPYSGNDDLSPDSLLSKRNRFVSLIPGPVDGSYMTTADLQPDVSYIRIDGRLWAYMSGLWDIHGDFLGGPFRSYTTFDEASRMMVCVDFYVMAPNERKRNYVKQLEAMINTVKFPGDAATAAALGGETEDANGDRTYIAHNAADKRDLKQIGATKIIYRSIPAE